MNLQTLLDKQKQLDDYIVKKHGLNESELFNKRALACLVEIGEQCNESAPFKYWKQNVEVDRAKVAEELVDVLHFLLSLGNLLGVKQDEATNEYIERAVKLESIEEQYISLFNLVSNISLFDEKVYKIKFWRHALSVFIGLYEMLGFGTGFIEAEYDKKHAENYARQERDY